MLSSTENGKIFAVKRSMMKTAWWLRHDVLGLGKDFIQQQRETGTYAFIHINKCGGTSVEAALGIPKVHDTAQERRDKLGVEAWNRLKTFSIIRHPYAKVASHYRYRVVIKRTGLGDTQISLNDWVRAAYRDHEAPYYDTPRSFLPCIDWLVDENGQIMVDYIAKLETIGQDWNEIQKLTGVTTELPEINKTKKAKDPTHGLDEGSRQILQDLFAKDFETFGYES